MRRGDGSEVAEDLVLVALQRVAVGDPDQGLRERGLAGCSEDPRFGARDIRTGGAHATTVPS